jgi:hypothetical protein
MGYGGRAGFYSYPVLEWVGGARRTRRIHGLGRLQTGDRIPYFTPQLLVVDEAAPPRVLVLAQRVPSARKVRVDWTTHTASRRESRLRVSKGLSSLLKNQDC